MSDADGKDMFADPLWQDVLAPWIGKLCLLYGVPFNHLVPDARALPPESIRFFFIDPNWLDALADGAFSIGKSTTRDEQQHLAAHAQIRAGNQGGPMSGVLLRSAAVSGWPGLDMKAFADREGSSAIAPLRVEQLAPDVLLGIFDGIAARVDITEPAESLHFGVLFQDGDSSSSSDPTVPQIRQIPLRYLETGGQAKAGAQIGGAYAAAVMRKDKDGRDTRVLDIRGEGGTCDALRAALQAAGGLAQGAPLSPAGFAVQMIESAEQQVFLTAAAPTPAPSGRE